MSEEGSARLDKLDELWYKMSTTGVGSWAPLHMMEEVEVPSDVVEWEKAMVTSRHPRSGPRTLVIHGGLVTHRAGVAVSVMKYVANNLTIPKSKGTPVVIGAASTYWTVPGWSRNHRQLQWSLDAAKSARGDDSLLAAAYDLEKRVYLAESSPVLVLDRIDAGGLWPSEHERLLDLVMSRSADPIAVTILTLDTLEPHVLGDRGETSMRHDDWTGFLTDPASCVTAELVL